MLSRKVNLLITMASNENCNFSIYSQPSIIFNDIIGWRIISPVLFSTIQYWEIWGGYFGPYISCLDGCLQFDWVNIHERIFIMNIINRYRDVFNSDCGVI